MPPMTAADKIRILVATDSHVGYQERDPIRKDDSWKSFDEIMRLAKSEDVDMVLLAGDLFHENTPSRKSMYQVMRSLRKNCLGERPCELEMLSDTNDVFDGSFNHVNYQDQDINVAIPVFSIHGNHDDPSGDGHYSALDLLQVAGLINYFGRTPESDNLAIKPILLQKGQTKLALYGMSNVRDERLFRTFRDGKVKFFKPGVQQNDWFNLMAVHQNHHAHTDTGYLPENFLPEFLDLVVWGHEHECLVDPRKNPETGFHVMQPGSSVATSLVPGEAETKHVAVVTITGKKFEVEKHRIKSVRPFIMREIQLANHKSFKGLANMKDNQAKVSKKLIEIVEEMITQAKEEWLETQDPEFDEEVPRPLVRLRVEYSSLEGKFDFDNPQRLSNHFADKVANISDVFQFHRKKAGARKKEEGDMPEESVLASMIDNTKIDKLVQEFLEAQSLRILPQAPFGDAVTQFVVKNDMHAIDLFVTDALADQVKEMLNLDHDVDQEDLEEAMGARKAVLEEMFNAGLVKTKRKIKYKPRPDTWDSDIDGEWEEQQQAIDIADDDDGEEDATPAAPTRRGRRSAFDDDSDDMEPVIEVPVKKVPAKRAPAKKVPAKTTTKAVPKKTPAAKAPARGRKKTMPSDDNDDDVIMIDEESAPKKPQPKRAAATRGTGTKQTQLTFSQTAKSTQKTEISEDEISDDDDAFAPAVSQQPARRR